MRAQISPLRPESLADQVGVAAPPRARQTALFLLYMTSIPSILALQMFASASLGKRTEADAIQARTTRQEALWEHAHARGTPQE